MTISYKLRRLAAFIFAAALVLSGCSAGGLELPEIGSGDKLREGAVPYAVPEFLDSGFDETQAQDYGCIRLDSSHAGQGYVAIQAAGENRLKLQVACGEMSYNYDVDNTGTTAVIPMNMGDGVYTLRLMEHIGDNRYACCWSGDVAVELEDEFQCFLRPSVMVKYTEGSDCVAKAKELAASCETDTDVASAIYKYLVRHISYDSDKASSVQSGYLPDPDETLATGKGICFDYAALAAAMMRSLGIPCRLITGYLDGNLYHAWNTFYTKEQGWVTVEIKVTPNRWQRVDITMAAGGTSSRELTDDTKYTTRFTY